MKSYDIIRKPLLSEKSYATIHEKVYTFVVDKSATKVDIKRAVEEMFKVEVESVITINAKGHKKSRNTNQWRTVGRTSDYKKAVVALKKESKPIAFFESLS